MTWTAGRGMEDHVRYQLGPGGRAYPVDEGLVLDPTLAERRRILIALCEMGGRVMDETMPETLWFSAEEVLAVIEGEGKDRMECRGVGED